MYFIEIPFYENRRSGDYVFPGNGDNIAVCEFSIFPIFSEFFGFFILYEIGSICMCCLTSSIFSDLSKYNCNLKSLQKVLNIVRSVSR